jgi:hypothetical protein
MWRTARRCDMRWCATRRCDMRWRATRCCDVRRRHRWGMTTGRRSGNTRWCDACGSNMRRRRTRCRLCMRRRSREMRRRGAWRRSGNMRSGWRCDMRSRRRCEMWRRRGHVGHCGRSRMRCRCTRLVGSGWSSPPVRRVRERVRCDCRRGQERERKQSLAAVPYHGRNSACAPLDRKRVSGLMVPGSDIPPVETDSHARYQVASPASRP